MAGRPNTQPFDVLPPFGGLLELPSAKAIPVTRLAAANNIVIDKGMPRPRPGLVRARTNPLSTFSAIKSAIDSPAYIVFNSVPSPDILYYTDGTHIQKVNVDGTTTGTVLGSLTSAKGIDIDVAPNPDVLYYCDNTDIKKVAVDGTGGASVLDPGALIDCQTLSLDIANTRIFYLANVAAGVALRRCTTAGATDTLLQTFQFGATTGKAIVSDNTNGIIMVGYNSASQYTIASYIVASGVTKTQYRSTGAIYGIALDLVHSKLYWTDSVRRAVMVADYTTTTGALANVTVALMLDATAVLGGIAIDATNQIIYGVRNGSSSATTTALDDFTSFSVPSPPWTASTGAGGTTATAGIVREGAVTVSSGGFTINSAYVGDYATYGAQAAGVVYDAITGFDSTGDYNIDLRCIAPYSSTVAVRRWAGEWRILGMMNTATPNPDDACFMVSVAVNFTYSRFDVVLYKVTGGVVTSVSTGNVALIAVDQTLRINAAVSGTTVSVTINGAAVASGTIAGLSGLRWGFALLNESSSGHTTFVTAVDEVVLTYVSTSSTSQGQIYSSNAADSIVSAFGLQRSLLGASSTILTDDVVLLQMLNRNAGGSSFKAWFPARTDPNDLFALTPGYTAGSGSNPDIFAMISRTANPASTDPFIPLGNYSRAFHAYTGKGLTTNEGGLLWAAGTGGYVFNFFKGDSAANEQQVVRLDGVPTGGTFKLKLQTTETGTIAYNASAATVASAVQTAIATDTASATCAGSGGPLPAAVTLTFAGTLANIGLPLLRATTISLTGGVVPDVDVSRSVRGQSHANGMLWLLPCGMPTPDISLFSFSAVGATANLNGAYEYRFAFYSSMLNLEGPASTITMPNITFAAQGCEITWSLPTTLYFNHYFSATSIKGGPLIDYLRIYRKHVGATISGGVADGVGEQIDHFLAAQTQLNDLRYEDNVADASQTADSAPAFNGYPPSDAQFVTVQLGRSFWAGAGRSIYNSQTTKFFAGAIEQGYQYVPFNAYTDAFDDQPSDEQITALTHLGNQLCVFTSERLIAGDVSDIDNQGIVFRRVHGAAGCAGQGCIAETTPLPGGQVSGAMLFYAHPKGGVYAYDGSMSQPVAREALFETIKAMSPKTWQDVSQGFGSIVSWYYASAVFDSYNNRFILSYPLTAGGSAVVSCSLDNDYAWTPWTMNKLTWFMVREWNSGALQARPVVCNTDGGSIFRVVNGRNDDGTDFSWFARFGRWNLGSSQNKKIYNATAVFDIDSFGGTAPTVNLAVYVGNAVTKPANGSVSKQLDTRQEVVLSDPLRDNRYAQFEISGTQSDNLDHPMLVALAGEFETTGMRYAQ